MTIILAILELRWIMKALYKTEANRNSNIEALRIVSMMLIVAWHYATQFSVGGGGVLDEKLSLFHVFAASIGLWGQIGVDLFIIISVSFLRTGNRFRSRKVISLACESIFYGIFWAGLYCAFVSKLSLLEIAKNVFAIFTGDNWFAFTYILLYIFHPILNQIIDKCSIQQLKKTTILLSIFVSGLRTIYHGIPVCDFLFMINIYFIVSYIEKSEVKGLIIRHSKNGAIFITTFLFVLHLIVAWIGGLIDSKIILSHSYYLNLRGSFIILADALFVFYYVNNRSPKHNRIINIVASTCFGVFLSHQFIAYRIWYRLLYREGIKDLQACVYMVFCIFTIFCSCSILDLLRQISIEKMLHALLKRKKVSHKLEKVDHYLNA